MLDMNKLRGEGEGVWEGWREAQMRVDGAERRKEETKDDVDYEKKGEGDDDDARLLCLFCRGRDVVSGRIKQRERVSIVAVVSFSRSLSRSRSQSVELDSSERLKK